MNKLMLGNEQVDVGNVKVDVGNEQVDVEQCTSVYLL